MRDVGGGDVGTTTTRMVGFIVGPLMPLVGVVGRLVGLGVGGDGRRGGASVGSDDVGGLVLNTRIG